MDKNFENNHFKQMSLADHLEELRKRLILALLGLTVGLAICMFFGKFIVDFITQPYIQHTSQTADLQVLSPAEGFMTYIKVCLLSGIILTSPWVFYQMWQFVAAGLYKNERRYVYVITPCSAILFIAGCIFCLKIAGPVTLEFFIKFNANVLNVTSRFTFRNYINFIVGLTLIFGLGFQTPLAVLFLNKLGIISVDRLKKSRKYVLLIVFIIAAILTPPGPIIQIMLALPLYILFEIGILLSLIFGRRAK